MRLGWLADRGNWKGGAELAAEELFNAVPDGITLVDCPASRPLARDVDGYVVNNCTSYPAAIIHALKDRPTVKILHDVWPYGDPVLRAYLLKEADLLILGSPVQRDAMAHQIDAPVKFIPHSVDFAPFEAAAKPADEREGVVWLGRIEQGKGLRQARLWAEEHGVEVDVYGFGKLVSMVQPPLRYMGQVEPSEVPEIFGRYKTFLFLPTEAEPYNRATVEAYAAGCELVLNGNVGPLYWIQNDPQAMRHAHSLVWGAILEVMGVKHARAN